MEEIVGGFIRALFNIEAVLAIRDAEAIQNFFAVLYII